MIFQNFEKSWILSHFKAYFCIKFNFLHFDIVELAFILSGSIYIFVWGVGYVTRSIFHGFLNIRKDNNGYFQNLISTIWNCIEKYHKNGLKSMIFQNFEKSRICVIFIFCISENVTGSDENRNLAYLTWIWSQFWEKIFFDIIWWIFEVFVKVICGFFVEISTRVEISTMKIFEKKVENVFYTACKYHEDWLISFENIAKRDRSFFVRPHSIWQT